MSDRPCKKCGNSDRYTSGNCKACSRVAVAAYRATHLDQAILLTPSDIERKRIGQAEWRLKNRAHIKAYNAEYAATHPKPVGSGSAPRKRPPRPPGPKRIRRTPTEERKRKDTARAARWYEKNKEKVLARVAMQYAKNPGKYLAVSNKWKSENKAQRKIHAQNRRARLKGNGGYLSPDLAEKLFRLQKGKCACCKRPLGEKFHLDHIMPLALGGPNADANIQLLTPTCNMRKNAKHPIDFMQERGLLL